MRKIIVTEFYTVDGLMSDPKDEMAWVLGSFNEAMGKYQHGIYEGADTLLLGRVTYKIFEGYWPTAETNPETPPGDAEMAKKMRSMTKIVFSKTIDSSDWERSFFVKEIDPAEIVKLKKMSGKDILVVGSASIAQQLTNLGLVDEYHLSVHPVILAEGKPLFKNIAEKVDLTLLGTEDFGNGVVLLKYQVRQGKSSV